MASFSPDHHFYSKKTGSKETYHTSSFDSFLIDQIFQWILWDRRKTFICLIVERTIEHNFPKRVSMYAYKEKKFNCLLLLVLFQWWIFTPDKAHTYKLLSIQGWSLLNDMKFKTIDKCSIEPGAKVIIEIDEASLTRSLTNTIWMNELNRSRLVILKISKITTINERWWDNLSLPVFSFRRCRICIATYICI